MTYQLKIQLKGITKPPVWRRYLVPADCTFFELHCMIQVSFGWGNEHLHKFQERPYDGGWTIQEVANEDEMDSWTALFNANPNAIDEKKETLQHFLQEHPIKKFSYIYDFGDSWIHEITVEAETDETLDFPRCIAGKGACPPEDCGGIWGYENMKYVLLESPGSKEAKEFRQWLKWCGIEKFDPKAFDLEEANEQVKGVIEYLRNTKEHDE